MKNKIKKQDNSIKKKKVLVTKHKKNKWKY